MSFTSKSGLLAGSYAILLCFGLFLLVSQGVAFRYSFPAEPPEWELPCGGDYRRVLGEGTGLPGPFINCHGSGAGSAGPSIFLLGDSHAKQLVFPLKEVADRTGMKLYLAQPNGDPLAAYPYSFIREEVHSDVLFDYVIKHSNAGDFFVTSIHRGKFNPSPDNHISMNVQLTNQSSEARTFEMNMMRFLPKLGEAGLNVYLIRDSPLLPDSMTSMSQCMYQFTEELPSKCEIDLAQDLHTRASLDQVFDNLDAAHGFVYAVDIAPELFRDDIFSPISPDGDYRMIDKHHLSEKGALELTPFFERIVTPPDRATHDCYSTTPFGPPNNAPRAVPESGTGNTCR